MKLIDLQRRPISVFVMITFTILICFWANPTPAAPTAPAPEKKLGSTLEQEQGDSPNFMEKQVRLGPGANGPRRGGLLIIVATIVIVAGVVTYLILKPARNGANESNQTWELTFQDSGSASHNQTVKVNVTPFTNSGTFSETSDSPGLWMYDASGKKCYRLPVGGNIVSDASGDRWSFVAMTGSGCGMTTLCSSSSGTANGNFPDANYISNGVMVLKTTSPLGTFSGTVHWTGTRL
jgi:hypothetical protein